MQEKKFASWTEFYKNSSAAITLQQPPIETQETCMCARSGLKPGQVLEHRHFVYQDVQVLSSTSSCSDAAYRAQGCCVSRSKQSVGSQECLKRQLIVLDDTYTR